MKLQQPQWGGSNGVRSLLKILPNYSFQGEIITCSEFFGYDQASQRVINFILNGAELKECINYVACILGDYDYNDNLQTGYANSYCGGTCNFINPPPK